MTVFGVTGGTGSGKTTALLALEDLGAAVVDCDRVYHGLLESCGGMVESIGRRFPGTVSSGRLDRHALGERVFNDTKALADLNAITHPYIYSAVTSVLEDAERQGRTAAAIDAIELFSSGLAELCGVTVFVTAPEDVRVRRIMERDGITREYALARIAAQPGDGYFRSRCDRELINNYPDSQSFYRRCLEFFKEEINNARYQR